MQAIATKIKTGVVKNCNFLIPISDMQDAADTILLNGIIHNPKVNEFIKRETRRLGR